MPPSILQFLSIAVFSFGAPAFVVLSFFYWRNQHRGTLLFRLFTAVCAAAFLLNLVSTIVVIDSPLFEGTRGVLLGLLGPLMSHLTLERAGRSLLLRRIWLSSVGFLYGLAFALAVAREVSASDTYDNAPSVVLGTCAVFSIAVLAFSTRSRAERVWMSSLFGAMLFFAAATIISSNPLFEIAPDYLLLLFFSVQLYYSERLAFFDVFLRLWAYVAIGMAILAPALLVVPMSRTALGGDWNQAWLAALACIPLWLLAPFLYRHIGVWVDRKALGRRFSPSEAQAAFLLKIQAAATEEDLRAYATEALEAIFDCPVDIHFESEGIAHLGDLLAPLAPNGSVLLKGRINQAPFLSDDRRLLESLTGTLSVMLQNARLRHQREDLIGLASRAELRALRAQINPHFLFNALNAVAGSITSKPEAAEDTLTQLAEVFRYTLNRSHTEWVPLVEEIEFLKAYLSVEKARFGARLQVEFIGTEVAADFSIPTMIIQTLVENAIKHGTSQVVGIGKVAIDIASLGAGLRITVSDNGPGFPAHFSMDVAARGHGLRNIAERLRGYYGSQAVLRWENGAGGTTVRIDIPTEARRQCAS